MLLNQIKVLTFDCYGTLIDWESAIIENIRKIWPTLQEEDNTILKWFADVEHQIQSEKPHLIYNEVLQEALKEISLKQGMYISNDQLMQFGASVKDWQPFADSVDALALLTSKFKLVIVSNIDNDSIAKTKNYLKVPFYKTYTAQDIGFYKPDQRVFRHVFNDMANDGIKMNEIMHVAESLYHDHVPAKDMGFASVWINRRHNKTGFGATPTVGNDFIPSNVFTDLISFARWIV